MSLEGQIAVDLRPDRVGDGRVRITSTRPTGLARHFAGRDIETVVRDLPLLFSVCGIAQATASVSACAQALDLEEPEATKCARELLVRAETLREHLIRILQGLSRLEESSESSTDPIRIMRVVPDLREALGADRDLFALGAAVSIDPAILEERIGALEDLLEEIVFGEAPAHWLARNDVESFEAWVRTGNTAASRLIAYVLRAGWPSSGRGSTSYLPSLPDRPLLERMTGADGESFVAQPDWQGEGPRDQLARTAKERATGCRTVGIAWQRAADALGGPPGRGGKTAE